MPFESDRRRGPRSRLSGSHRRRPGADPVDLLPETGDTGRAEFADAGDGVEVEHVGEQLLGRSGLDPDEALRVDDQAAPEAGRRRRVDRVGARANSMPSSSIAPQRSIATS